MKTSICLMLSLIALFLAACGQDVPTGGGSGGQLGSGEAYTDVFFKVIEEAAPNNVIVGTATPTLSVGQLSGTLTAYGDSEDFPNNTGTLSGTVQAGQVYGEKQRYTADVRIDFESAPDYAASGSVHTVDRNVIFTQEPMVLSRDGSPVGKFILEN